MDRYIRNKQLDGFGSEAQERLGQSRVLVIGAGALGSVAAMYLAGSGVGHLCVVDFDNIDITNLQRQLSYTEGDVGKSKAEALAARLRSINSEIDVEARNTFLRRADIDALVKDYDLVVEGSDNPDTKYAVTESCEAQGIPYALGGVAQYRGQAMSWCPGYPGYSAFFPLGAEAGGYMPCSVGGVFGPAPGIVASIQASEVIKLLTGIGQPLLGRLLLIDVRTMKFQTVRMD
ncbi:MAG: HesA/MoeB/ThiF family protein [Bacteroidales bacterium]|nr:HesA/MoeB/ThiF family protein [Bacteroidales bacterium]